MVEVENANPNLQATQAVPGKLLKVYKQSNLIDIHNSIDDAPVETKVRGIIKVLESLDRTYFGNNRVKKIRE